MSKNVKDEICKGSSWLSIAQTPFCILILNRVPEIRKYIFLECVHWICLCFSLECSNLREPFYIVNHIKILIFFFLYLFGKKIYRSLENCTRELVIERVHCIIFSEEENKGKGKKWQQEFLMVYNIKRFTQVETFKSKT